MKILITRPDSEAPALKRRLADMGHDAISCPMLVIKPHLDAAVDLDGAQAIAVTSAAAIRALGWLDQDHGLPIYAVGSASAQAAQDMGFYVAHVGAGDVADLAKAVTAALDPVAGAIVHPRGATVAGDLAGTLTAAGFTVRGPVLYDAQHITELPASGRRALAAETLAAVLFFSAQTAQTFASVVNEADLTGSCNTLAAICLSQAVADAADALPWRTVRVAPDPNQDSLLTALANS